jgi:COX assembly protein 1
MSAYDKSEKRGYDEQDTELNGLLQQMYDRNPGDVQKLYHRVHDGILSRLKEEATRKCYDVIQPMERCINENIGREYKCLPFRDIVNECFRHANTEADYQRLRISYLKGDLKRMHDERMATKVEAFKSQAPDALPNWKVDYPERYQRAMENIGVQPIAEDDILPERTATSGTAPPININRGGMKQSLW